MLELSSESSGHDCQNFQGPDDHVEVAVVNESLDKFADVSVFGVGKFWNACCFDKVFKHFGLLAPFSGF